MCVKVVLGGDGGATNTTLFLARADTGRVLGKRHLETRPSEYDQMLLDIQDATGMLLGRHGLTSEDLVGVGIGVAAFVKKGRIVRGANLPGWRDKPLQQDLAILLGCQVVVLNDAVMSALGEFCEIGEPVVFVSLGTGAGIGRAEAPVIRGGFPVVHAAEGGHTVIDVRSLKECGCGGRGCWEALVGGTHLPGRFRGHHPADASDELWQPVLGDIAVGLHNVAMIFPDYTIVVGGGVMMKQQHRFEELTRLYLARKSTIPPEDKPKLRLPVFGEESGVYGAIHAARQLI